MMDICRGGCETNRPYKSFVATVLFALSIYAPRAGGLSIRLSLGRVLPLGRRQAAQIVPCRRRGRRFRHRPPARLRAYIPAALFLPIERPDLLPGLLHSTDSTDGAGAQRLPTADAGRLILPAPVAPPAPSPPCPSAVCSSPNLGRSPCLVTVVLLPPQIHLVAALPCLPCAGELCTAEESFGGGGRGVCCLCHHRLPRRSPEGDPAPSRRAPPSAEQHPPATDASFAALANASAEPTIF